MQAELELQLAQMAEEEEEELEREEAEDQVCRKKFNKPLTDTGLCVA